MNRTRPLPSTSRARALSRTRDNASTGALRDDVEVERHLKVTTAKTLNERRRRSGGGGDVGRRPDVGEQHGHRQRRALGRSDVDELFARTQNGWLATRCARWLSASR